MYSGFFQNKTVLVTGVAGVKGTWLAQALLRCGARVIGVDSVSPGVGSSYSAADLGTRIEFIQGDVADLPLMTTLVERCDGVFHLAAMALVHEARRNPFEAYRSNTMGVVSVLEAVRVASHPVSAVFVTTDKVYRPKGGELWLESDPLGASGAYAVSKACAEHVIADYQKSYFAGSDKLIGVGRAGNVLIGGDLHSTRSTNGAGRIFVDCYEALSEGRAPEIFSPGFTRPYTYGLDVVSGYMSLMAGLSDAAVAGEAFNFGPCEERGVSNALLATKICELWGTGIMWRTGPPRTEPFEFQSLSIRKSEVVLGWRPAYTLFEALRETTRWYREWARLGQSPAEGSMRELNEDLLAAHEVSARHLAIRWAA